MKARKKVIQGGTSAGKTHGIIPVLIDKAAKNKLKITVVAETIPAVKDGAVDIFKEVMHDTNRWNEKGWIGNPMEYTFANGSRIQFKAFDSVGKAKAAGKRDILFINEANHIPFNIADALMIRSKETWLDYNPDNEFWAHTEVLQEPNSEFLLLKYTDNEAIPEETLEDLMLKKEKAKTSKYWENWCKIYIDGEIGSLDGIIFSDWQTIDAIPEEADYKGSGMDFGYTNDPTTLVDVYKYNDRYIFDEQLYEKGLVNPDIAKMSKYITRTISGKEVMIKRFIYADSAEPKSIKEIAMFGVGIMGADKGQDSIRFGLNLLQSNPFLVTSSSHNLINELRRYAYDKDKEGNALNKPIDSFNHAIDAMRYWAMMAIGRSQKVDIR